MKGSCKHSSLLHYGNNYGSKKFNSTVPALSFVMLSAEFFIVMLSVVRLSVVAQNVVAPTHVDVWGRRSKFLSVVSVVFNDFFLQFFFQLKFGKKIGAAKLFYDNLTTILKDYNYKYTLLIANNVFKKFVSIYANTGPGTNVIKLFTSAIYECSF